MQAEAFHSSEDKRAACELFASVPTAYSRIFKEYAHCILSKGTKQAIVSSYPLVRVGGPGQAKYQCSPETLSVASFPTPSIVSKLFRGNQAVRFWRSTLEFSNKPPLPVQYCRPIDSNNLGFDSFVATKEDLYIFQMTVSPQQSGDSKQQKKLQLLKQIFPHKGARSWHYILVVPRSDPREYTLTLMKGMIELVDSFQLWVLDMTIGNSPALGSPNSTY